MISTAIHYVILCPICRTVLMGRRTGGADKRVLLAETPCQECRK